MRSISGIPCRASYFSPHKSSRGLGNLSKAQKCWKHVQYRHYNTSNLFFNTVPVTHKLDKKHHACFNISILIHCPCSNILIGKYCPCLNISVRLKVREVNNRCLWHADISDFNQLFTPPEKGPATCSLLVFFLILASNFNILLDC